MCCVCQNLVFGEYASTCGVFARMRVMCMSKSCVRCILKRVWRVCRNLVWCACQYLVWCVCKNLARCERQNVLCARQNVLFTPNFVRHFHATVTWDEAWNQYAWFEKMAQNQNRSVVYSAIQNSYHLILTVICWFLSLFLFLFFTVFVLFFISILIFKVNKQANKNLKHETNLYCVFLRIKNQI